MIAENGSQPDEVYKRNHLPGREPRVLLDDSRANVTVIRAFLDSARSGQPVRLEGRSF